MTRMSWGAPTDRKYESGLDRGVLYVDGQGTPWNGLVSVTESSSGAETKSLYLDGFNYANRTGIEQFTATIEAFYTPREFDACEGIGRAMAGLRVSNQRRKSFDLCYRTFIEDAVGNDHLGYKINLIYNALASPTTRSRRTISPDLGLEPLSWDVITRPKRMPGFRPAAHLSIDTTELSEESILSLENILYGSESTEPRMPEFLEVVSLLETLTVVDHGDGSWTASSPNESVVGDNGDGTFTITSEAVEQHADGTFSIHYS